MTVGAVPLVQFRQMPHGVLDVPEQFDGAAIPEVSKDAVAPGGGSISMNWPEKNPELPDRVMVIPAVVPALPVRL
ncbi:MAG: hypothetical protein DMG37_24065 [Acidobacteria bacterium]|nr:MAG: hypothetical protein DMG37_24065 [Acidobacteriota bacterium]